MTRTSSWARGRSVPLIGAWGLLGTETASILAATGFDWIGLDAQHGLFDDAAVVAALHLIPPAAADVLVRVPQNDAAWIGRALDAGARGVIVPMVETPNAAAAAAAACRYPPAGRRSLGQFAEPWALDDEPVLEANDRVVCAVMVETATGLAHVEQIAATPGIDLILVGPFDLSLSLGQPLESMIAEGVDGPLGLILRACLAHDVIPGAFAGTLARARALREMGYQALALASDVSIIRAGASALLSSFGTDDGKGFVQAEASGEVR